MTPRLFYVGQLWLGSTCLGRAEALRALGWEVVPFDMTPYLRAGGVLLSRIQHRLLVGPAVARFNRDLVRAASGHGRFEAVWIDKGRWIHPSTLERIRNCTGAILVHYTPDPAFAVHTSRHFERSLPLYDVCVTTKRYELDAYRRHGAREVVFTWQGIDERFERIPECADIESSDRHGAVFIGHCERHYESVLREIARHDIDLRIYGDGWERAAKRDSALARCVAGGGVWGDDYARTLASAAVGIGLLSKYYPDQFTTRSFEIPAAGAMLLAERTDEHRRLFNEGLEAEFFSDTKELIEKLAAFLSRDMMRLMLARRGRQRVMTSFHWRHVLAPVIERLKAMCGIR